MVLLLQRKDIGCAKEAPWRAPSARPAGGIARGSMRPTSGILGGQARLEIAPVGTLLVSASLLVLGNGLQGTLLLVRAGNEGFGGEAIGIMMSAYFAGYAVGALLLPRVVASAGHIRAFAGFAAIASAVPIAPVPLIEPWVLVALQIGRASCRE